MTLESADTQGNPSISWMLWVGSELCAALAWPFSLILLVIVIRKQMKKLPGTMVRLRIRKISLGRGVICILDDRT